jgi:hypothetical protein
MINVREKLAREAVAGITKPDISDAFRTLETKIDWAVRVLTIRFAVMLVAGGVALATIKYFG